MPARNERRDALPTGPALAGGVQLAAARAVADAEDSALAARVQRGDHDAFGQLARRHAQRAFVVAYRVVRQREDAEDLVQDALLAALNKIATYDTSRPFAPWFLRIVHNRALNEWHARGARERRITPVDAAQLEATSAAAAAAPDTELEQLEIREQFALALRGLSERRRLIVQLADVDELSSQEISDVVGLPAGTVRWHLHEARRALRESMAPLADRSIPRRASSE